MKCSQLIFLFVLVQILTMANSNIRMKKHLDQRTNLKFLVGQDKSPIQCWRELMGVYGDETMSKETVRHWHKRFREGDGHTPVTDEVRSGRPPTQATAEKIQMVSTLIQNNGRKTIGTIAKEVQMSWSSARNILLKKLNLRHKTAKFVPQILTDEQEDACTDLQGQSGKVEGRPVLAGQVGL